MREWWFLENSIKAGRGMGRGGAVCIKLLLDWNKKLWWDLAQHCEYK
jgi:hypothetical protein